MAIEAMEGLHEKSRFHGHGLYSYNLNRNQRGSRYDRYNTTAEFDLEAYAKRANGQTGTTT